MLHEARLIGHAARLLYLISVKKANINCKELEFYNIVLGRSEITHRKQQMSFYCDPSLIFGPLDICTVNHCPPVGLCLGSNEDRGTIEHFANLDQMAIWSRKCDVVSF